MPLKPPVRFAFAAALAAGSVLAVAATTPQDAADYRKSVMTTFRGHVGAASMHVRGLVEDKGFLVKHAQGLANGAAELEHLFPARSNVDDSDALPVIWEEPEEFSRAIAAAVTATRNFAAAAESGDADALRAAFREVGGACRGCHDRFRVPQD